MDGIIAMLVILVVIGGPFAWLVSEFHAGRRTRIALGILAILCSIGVSFIVGKLSELSYNAWYGAATEELVTTTVKEIEDGNLERVMAVLRGLELQYRPTYESRARYDILVLEATARMRGGNPMVEASGWAGWPSEWETWAGHWESEQGSSFVIGGFDGRLDIVGFTPSPIKMHSVSLSEDSRTLKFQEGSYGGHVLTLVSEYEARDQWLDLEGQNMGEPHVLHKLVRATEKQKEMTQQPD